MVAEEPRRRLVVPRRRSCKELDALVTHLETHAPWGATVEVTRTKEAPPFRCETDGPGYAAARSGSGAGLRQASGRGGVRRLEIPLLRTLQQAAPKAEFILWGAEDTALSRIHASDESVDPGEIERLVVAQSLLLQQLTEKSSG